jgi:hypothetical protein
MRSLVRRPLSGTAGAIRPLPDGSAPRVAGSSLGPAWVPWVRPMSSPEESGLAGLRWMRRRRGARVFRARRLPVRSRGPRRGVGESSARARSLRRSCRGIAGAIDLTGHRVATRDERVGRDPRWTFSDRCARGAGGTSGVPSPKTTARLPPSDGPGPSTLPCKRTRLSSDRQFYQYESTNAREGHPYLPLPNGTCNAFDTVSVRRRTGNGRRTAAPRQRPADAWQPRWLRGDADARVPST